MVIKEYIKERIEKAYLYMTEKDMTIRSISKKLQVSKSTIYDDLTKRLERVSKEKYDHVMLIMKKHADYKHLVGGEKTRLKYLD